MKAALVALAALPLLGGCVAVHYPDDWTRASTGVPELTADEVDCDRASRTAAWTPDLVVGGIVDVAREMIERAQLERAYAGCMRARGYSRT